METKVLVFRDTKRADQLRDTVAEVADRCNELTDLFNAFQPWVRINSVSEFEKLVNDPGKFFDETIVANVQVNGGGRSVNPEAAAALFDISRAEFLNICAGIPVNDPECRPCQKMRMKAGQRIVTVHTFNAYKEYLEFADGLFSINPDALEQAAGRFLIYADSPAQLAIVSHFDEICKALNSHLKLFGMTDQKTVANALKLHLSEGMSGNFMPDRSYLVNQILTLKQQGK